MYFLLLGLLLELKKILKGYQELKYVFFRHKKIGQAITYPIK